MKAAAIALTCLILTPFLRAQEPPSAENTKKIPQAVPLAFTQRCLSAKQAGDVAGSLTRYIYNVVGGGLDALERLDPELVAQIYRNVSGVPLTIDCDPDLGTRYFRRDILFWSKHRLNIREVGQSLRRIRGAPGPDKKLIGPAWDFEAEGGTPENKNKLFHEFLHHARVPGLSDHNGLAPDGPTVNRRQLDRVYACAGLAFPSERVFVAWEPARRYNMTAQACRACLQGERDECGQFPEGPSPSVKVHPPKNNMSEISEKTSETFD